MKKKDYVLLAFLLICVSFEAPAISEHAKKILKQQERKEKNEEERERQERIKEREERIEERKAERERLRLERERKKQEKIEQRILEKVRQKQEQLRKKQEKIQKKLERIRQKQEKIRQELNFEKILLVVNFNHPFYQNIPFIEEIYSPIFPNIVFYGEHEHEKIIEIFHNKGWYSQYVLQHAMENFPDYEGYLFVQDDCFVNFWNLGRLDKDKLWYITNTHLFHLEKPSDGKRNRGAFWWWDFSWRPFLRAMRNLDDKHLKMFMKNQGGKIYSVTHGWADFVYIPQRLREDFLQVVQYFKQPIFQEIAISATLMCIEDRANWEYLRYQWTIGNRRGAPIKKYNTRLDWFHPIKFSDDKARVFVNKRLKKFWPRLDDKKITK